MKTLKEIAESILTRPLKKEDGLTFSEIEEIETDLGIKLPNILREFYSLVGGLDMLFINSFECFIKPYIKNGMLVFLEENEGLCYWGVKMQKLSNAQLNVYMCTDVEQNNTEWVSEEVTLDGFLSMLLYYQAASGGYEYSGAISETEFESRDDYLQCVSTIIKDWAKVVVYKGLIIYQEHDKLILCFPKKDGDIEDTIFASALTDKSMKQLEKYGFKRL